MSSFGFDTTADEIVHAFPEQVRGRTFAITGTSPDGLGASAAIALSRASPAHLILLSRNKNKVIPVINEIMSINPTIKVTFITVDLDDLNSVREAAKEVSKATDHIDVLINNAGVMAIPHRTTNKDGIEMTLATNHLGHFLLTKLLLPIIIAAAASSSQNGTASHPRIINLTSRGHQISPFIHHDPNFTTPRNPYNPWTAYGQSKTANIQFTLLLSQSRTLHTHKIRSFAVHPGGIYTTGLSTHLTAADFEQIKDITLRNTGQEFTGAQSKNLAQGTSSMLWAALDPSLNEVIADSEAVDPARQGLYIADCNFGVCREHARDQESAMKVWAWSEEMVGEKFDV